MKLNANKFNIGDRVTGKPGTVYDHIVNDVIIKFDPTPNTDNQLNPVLKKGGEISEDWLIHALVPKYTKDYILKNKIVNYADCETVTAKTFMKHNSMVPVPKSKPKMTAKVEAPKKVEGFVITIKIERV